MTTLTSSSHFAEVVYDPLSLLSMLPCSILPTSWSMSFGEYWELVRLNTRDLANGTPSEVFDPQLPTERDQGWVPGNRRLAGSPPLRGVQRGSKRRPNYG